MHELINKLAFSLFKKSNIEDCSIDEIKELAEQYPYFSSAQVLLAAKQKQASDPDLERQLNTASVHVPNSLWLDHLLNSPSSREKILIEQRVQIAEVLGEPNNDELVIEKGSKEFVIASKKEEEVVKEEIIVADPPQPITEKGESKEEALVFNPYYTVDYFASQGIKNVIEEKPKDRFSQQLKSFTEWLKTIRQLPPQQVAVLTDFRSEEKVVELATHSLDEKNVETEAMAEVWIKQGHPEKAADIYRKLSLLNPSKSSYFASLIENLKKS